MSTHLFLAVLLTGLLGGCGDDDEGPPADGGRDASGGGDSGPPRDSGPGVDGGPGVDSGPRPDGGPLADGGPLDGAPVSMPCMAAGICDPFNPDTCPAGDICLPGGDAGAACATASMTTVGPGEMCGRPDACPPGYLCIDFGDGFTCQKMCPEGSIGFCGGELRCIGTIGDECVRICRPRAEPCDIYTQDCADATDACTFVTDGETGAPYTGCRPAGMQTDGEPCGGGMGSCASGLVCIRSGETNSCHHVCRDMGGPACPGTQTCTGFARTWMVNYCETPP